MRNKYPDYKQIDLVATADRVLKLWKEEKLFEKTILEREGAPPFVFYEGPPSANGQPGIHHVMARTIKDLFCRFKTQKGFQVKRKAGWDTHGLPVELGVEKELGITKEDIGSKISVEDYNKACKEAVMKYTDLWNDLTEKMGYWVDMEHPYVTYENEYIESVWWLLSQMYQKGMLYKGYTIQPFSPAAGTGLSSHELNLPGCYKDVKDTSCVAAFKVKADQEFKNSVLEGAAAKGELHFLAWTTTPWTLPSNTALTVGKKIDYLLVDTFNPYTASAQKVVLAKALLQKYFKPEGEKAEMSFISSGKLLPYRILQEFKGEELLGIKYHQLLDYAQPFKDADKAFVVIPGDFVTTEDGTGIVHTAPTFGADDMQVATAAGVPPLLVKNEKEELTPLVDTQGRFVTQVNDLDWGFAGEPVKAEYLSETEMEIAFETQKKKLIKFIPKLNNYLSVDERIALKLKLEGKAFKVEKYEHNYPHCWRTDKPILYYPLDSWFIKSTAVRDRMIALNKTINWKPESTGTGRFGNWLENMNDWNLSRSRYWGTPLPIWRSGPYGPPMEECIESVEALKQKNAYFISPEMRDENGKRLDGHALRKTLGEMRMKGENVINFWNELIRSRKVLSFASIPSDEIDLHRPFVDYIVFFRSGLVLSRELDLIDVWFDSGAMPYAQLHYPFENKELVDNNSFFPADFIAEGVDQTRGWFYTLHAISTIIKDNVAFKNVVSNGLVLDKNGQKMSKRLGNAINPFETLARFGPDATRWYMISNSQPWDNLKFDLEGITEVQRKFFRALQNSYAFFALYANIDGFDNTIQSIPMANRTELDQWIISKLNSLIQLVNEAYEDYEPTKAARAIQDFTVDDLSNWFVRLSRKRFWRGEFDDNKKAAYQTLYYCLKCIAQIAAPIAPFYSDALYRDLVKGFENSEESVHLASFPEVNKALIDLDLEERMGLAQKITSLILALRKKEGIRVRQPLQKILVPALNQKTRSNIEAVKDWILTEVNVKEIEILDENSDLIQKEIKPNFKALGPKFGKNMKVAVNKIQSLTKQEIQQFEDKGTLELEINDHHFQLSLEDVEIKTKDIPGFLVASDAGLTVSLDINITEDLRAEGAAREMVNKIQNLRKGIGLEVTDRIDIEVLSTELTEKAILTFKAYICSETLANNLTLVPQTTFANNENVVLEENEFTEIAIQKN